RSRLLNRAVVTGGFAAPDGAPSRPPPEPGALPHAWPYSWERAPLGGTGQQGLVQVRLAGGEALHGEASRPGRAGLDEAAGQRRVVEDAGEPVGEGGDVAGGDEHGL